jgi:hypothetical protein
MPALSQRERLRIWKEEKNRKKQQENKKAQQINKSTSRWAMPRTSGLKHRPFRKSIESTNSSVSNCSSNSNRSTSKSNLRGVRRHKMNEKPSSSDRNTENSVNNLRRFSTSSTSSTVSTNSARSSSYYEENSLRPKTIQTSLSSKSLTSVASTISLASSSSNTSPTSRGRPPLSPIHVDGKNKVLRQNISSAPVTVKSTPSPIVVDEMDSRQMLDSSFGSDIESGSFNIDSLFITKRGGDKNSNRGSRRGRRESMHFDLSSLKSISPLGGSSRRSSSSSTDEVMRKIEEVEKMVQLTKKVDNNSKKDDIKNEEIVNVPSIPSVVDRVDGTVGRLLTVQLNAKTKVQELQMKLMIEQNQINSMKVDLELANNLISKMKEDAATMMCDKLALQNELSKMNAARGKPEEKEEKEESLQKQLNCALQSIKTLQFENEIALQQMNEQREQFESDLLEMEMVNKEKEVEEKENYIPMDVQMKLNQEIEELTLKNETLEKEKNNAIMQAQQVTTKYQNALKKALARNKELNTQLNGINQKE